MQQLIIKDGGTGTFQETTPRMLGIWETILKVSPDGHSDRLLTCATPAGMGPDPSVLFCTHYTKAWLALGAIGAIGVT